MSQDEKQVHLIAASFDDVYKADEARLVLRRAQGEGLIDLDETAVVIRELDGKLKLSQDEDVEAKRRNEGHWLGIAAAGLTTAIAPKVALLSFNIEGDNATVDFNRAFETADTQPQVAQVVYTLTQFTGLNTVTFLIDGEPNGATGVRPRNGASCMKAFSASPLVRTPKVNSATILPSSTLSPCFSASLSAARRTAAAAAGCSR